MPAEAKVQENRVRRALHRQGYSLVKCRARDPRVIGFGQYFITDRRTNTIVAGGATQGGLRPDARRYGAMGLRTPLAWIMHEGWRA